MYTKLNGKRIFFDVLSDGLMSTPDGRNIAKPALFALHGGPGMDHSGIKPCMQPLQDIAQVVLFDQRGSGLSDSVTKDEWSMELMSKDIEGLKNCLGLDKIILLGISFGGMLALDYALRFPDSLSGLVLVATTPSERAFEEAAKFASELKDEKLKENAFKLLRGGFKDDDDLKETLAITTPLYSNNGTPEETRKMLKHLNLNSFVLNSFFSGKCGKYDLEDRLGEINVPTLIIGGEDDWICPISQSRIMNEKIPNSKLVVFEKGKHFIFNDERQKYVSTVRTFIEKISNQV